MKRRSSFLLRAAMVLTLSLASAYISFAQEGQEKEARKEKAVEGEFARFKTIAGWDKAKRLQEVRWGNNITQDDKEAVIGFLEAEQSPIVLYFDSHVLKADLDGNGQAEFVLNGVVKNPTMTNYGTVVGVVANEGAGFRFLSSGEPTKWFIPHWELSITDFDGDGYQDIVLHTEVEAYGEVPPFDATIYKNQGMKNFPRVYLKAIHSYLQFEDLDGDGRIELLEPVMGVERKGLLSPPEKLWINIYNWTGTEFVDSSDRYLDFYLTKEAEYKELLVKYEAEYEEELRKYGKEGGKRHASWVVTPMISIYEEYLYKIKFLKSRHQSVQ